MTGLIGRDLTLEDGHHAARLTALSILASLKQELGDLGRITQWIRTVGYVHCEAGLATTPPSSTSTRSACAVEARAPALHVRVSEDNGRCQVLVKLERVRCGATIRRLWCHNTRAESGAASGAGAGDPRWPVATGANCRRVRRRANFAREPDS